MSTLNEYFNIMREDIPAWYEISWDDENKAIVVRVHRAVLNQLGLLTNEAPIIRILSTDIDLSDFVPFGESNWGFGQVLEQIGEDDKYISFRVSLPRVIWTISKAKREDRFGFKGLPERGYNWQAAYNLSASLNVLFLALAFSLREEIIWENEIPQLVNCKLQTSKESYGGALSIRLSKALVDWLAKYQVNEDIPEASEALFEAYSAMYEFKDEEAIAFNRHYLNARVLSIKQRITLNCPGDACGLDPDNMNEIRDRGYELVPHNTDTPIQQLTLLAGVAKLCDIYREDLA